MHFDDYVSRLRTRLQAPLPGLTAQRTMAPRGRLKAGYETPPPDARHGAVLLLLLDAGSGTGTGPGHRAGGQTAPRLPLIVRADDGTAHGGQIGLPGGGYEEGDTFPTGTALREAEEEIAAVPAQVELIGALTPLYISVSNYHITPVVGTYRGDARAFVPNPIEVEDILIASVDELLAGHADRTVDARGIPMRVPAYVWNGVDVWGATAMMLSEFFAVHRQICAPEGEPGPCVEARGGGNPGAATRG